MISYPSRAQSQKKPVKELLSQAMMHHERGEFSRAEKFYKRALKIDPNHCDALHLSGLIAHQLGRNPRAVKLIRKAILNDNSQAIFHNNLAVIHNKMGNWAEAETASLSSLKLSPDDAETLSNLGQALAGLGRIREAINAYERSLRLRPDNALVYCNLATLLTVLSKFEDAEVACRAALKLQPNLAKALHSLGVVHSATGNLDEAEESFKQAYDLNPLNDQTITNLASIYSTRMKFDEAICLFQQALKKNPLSAEAYFNLGVCLSEKGDMEEALNCFETAIEIDPDNVDAYYALATSGKIKLKAEQLQHLAILSKSPFVSDENAVKLSFALAWQAEKQGLLAPAITFCTEGNAKRKDLLATNGHEFDPALHTILAERVEKVFTASFFGDRIGFGMKTEVPVFIVGMPRSGTSLVEKIIDAHPEICGAGERHSIPNLVKILEGKMGQALEFPEVVMDLDKAESVNLAVSELEMLGGLSGVRRLVDKLPLNYLYLGLIALLYPRAKIIHCKRDPRDVAVSCYFQNFVHALPWSCDLGHIGIYYNTYSRVMTHWHKVSSLAIHDVQYEDLVSDLEGKSQELVEFLGLKWDVSCLNFHTSPGPVRTASKWQVREPIYRSSVGRWRAFEQYLGPLFRTLNSTGL